MAAIAAGDGTAGAAVVAVPAEVEPSQEAERRKEEGNRLFRDGAFEEALLCYAGALEALEVAGCQRLPLRSTLASNQAMCYLKLERPAEAEERASAALAADPGNGKAAYRRGLARLAVGADPRGALEDLQKAARLEPQQGAEIRRRADEARRLVEAAEAAGIGGEGGEAHRRETAVAEGAASALGGADGGLYGDKADLNEGRLAETHMEQRAWVQSIDVWTEISEVAFLDEEAKSCVSVYMTLPGVQGIPPNKVCVWMQPTALEVRVIDLSGKNYFWIAQELWGQIDPGASSYKIRKDKLSLKLAKRPSARSFDRWEKLRRI